MEDTDFALAVDRLIDKLKHYLITTLGSTIDEATDFDLYRSLALALREEIMINWTAMGHTLREKRARKVHYLCMEYMPGRFMLNNILSMGTLSLVQAVVEKLGRSLVKILSFEPDPGLGNGGLGRLAACLLDSLATLQYPATGYGLRYQYGIFDQEIWDGQQVERPDTWLLFEDPWEFRRDTHSVSVKFAGRAVPLLNASGEEVHDLYDCEEVRALAYDYPIVGFRTKPDFNVVTLRLWSTKDSPRNFQLQRYNAGQIGQAAENTSLTDVLYPNDNNETGKRIRLKQEFLLSSASVQDILLHHMAQYNDIYALADLVRIQINDTHPTLAIIELMRFLLKDYNFKFMEAFEMAKACTSYTNHTVLKEALEEWNQNRMATLLPRQYAIIEKLNFEFCNAVRAKYPQDEDRVRRLSMIEGGQIRMAHICAYGTHKINGVAALHSEILKKTLFKDFYEMYPEKFINITNGVSPRRWLIVANHRLAEFLNKNIGPEWMTDFSHIEKVKMLALDPAMRQQFMDIRRVNKLHFIAFLKEHNPLRDSQGRPIPCTYDISPDALFDVQVKRIHEYKRQLMNALSVLMTYLELRRNPQARPCARVVIFAGKAAPGYQMAKNIIRFICSLSRHIQKDSRINGWLRVVYIENYNVTRAEKIIAAADLSQQISTAGMEASGTGNMKLSMNGALTIGTEDGSNIELRKAVGDEYWPFLFGKKAEEILQMQMNKSYNPWEIYTRNSQIREAVDCLKDHTLAENNEEHEAFLSIYHGLLDVNNGGIADPYFVLADLESYYETQKKVEQLYLDRDQWTKYGMMNIAATSFFSIDRATQTYAKEAWDLTPCGLDPTEFAKVQEEYAQHDKCRIR